MLDRLAALMLLATAVLGSAALIYALRGDDRLGKHFHALFQFQLLGINGAFLTGDLFNLFVFFEILLIASYALLHGGGGAERVRSGLHYVILNLVGSAFFLIAVGTLYGLTGTLNMADMAQKIAMADAERAPLLAAAGLLLLVVFALKAALLPLYFWLPRLCRGQRAGGGAVRDHDQGRHLLDPAGLHAGLRRCRRRAGQPGAGLALAAGPGDPRPGRDRCLGGADPAKPAGLPGGGLRRNPPGWRGVGQRAGAGGVAVLPAAQYLDRRWPVPARRPGRPPARRQGRRPGQGPALQNPRLLGGAFFIGAIAVAGLPPLSGFFGKVMLLQSVAPGSQALALWSVVLGSGLVALVALSRAGSTLFWRTGHTVLGSAELDHGRLFACILLLSAGPLLVFAAKPLLAYVQATAAQLHDLDLYRQIITRGGAA